MNTETVPSSYLIFPHLQEMSQHHVHVHVLLLPPAAHEAQVLSASDGARLQRLFLSLQEGFHRESEFRGVLQHLWKERYSRWIVSIHLRLYRIKLISSALTRSESRWKAVDRCPELYCSAGRQSTTKKRTPSWKENQFLSHFLSTHIAKG